MPSTLGGPNCGRESEPTERTDAKSHGKVLASVDRGASVLWNDGLWRSSYCSSSAHPWRSKERGCRLHQCIYVLDTWQFDDHRSSVRRFQSRDLYRCVAVLCLLDANSSLDAASARCRYRRTVQYVSQPVRAIRESLSRMPTRFHQHAQDWDDELIRHVRREQIAYGVERRPRALTAARMAQSAFPAPDEDQRR